MYHNQYVHMYLQNDKYKNNNLEYNMLLNIHIFVDIIIKRNISL